MTTVTILPMWPEDAMRLARQRSQQVQLGLHAAMTEEHAHDIATNGEAWTAWRDSVPIACMGLRETFVGVQGVAWAILSEGIGSGHIAITRFARHRIAESPLIRIEAIVNKAVPAEIAWAEAVGLEIEGVLRKFGASSEDHVLFSRIR